MKRFIQLTLLLFAALPLAAQKNHNFEVSKNLDVFNSLYKQLDLNYVDTLDANKLIKNAANYMLSGLDPYTEYYTNEDRSDLKQMLTGKYAGIGALIHYYKKKDRCIIAEPYENMPAADAGLKAGDIILSIDGKDPGVKGSRATDDYTSSISSGLRGLPGTELTLKVERPGQNKPLVFKIKRRAIQLPSLPYYGMVADSVGYVYLSQFTEGCAKEMRRAIIDLKTKGAKALVLDLRGNGGGSLSEAIDIVNLFIPKGREVVHTKGKVRAANSVDKTRNDALDEHIPLAVLVNGGSASASEITSGALQDLDRAVIVGSQTYGKGLVQQTRELPYNGVLKLTTAKYYIPSGRCVQAIDYSHRNSDGSVGRIPDSLTHVFHTAAGREVRDGGGIRPDILPQRDSLPNIVIYLSPQMSTGDVLFDFVTEYTLRHATIAAPETFDISDEEYELFKAKAIRDTFKYDRQSERILQELKRVARIEGYANQAANAFKLLEEKLKHDTDYDLTLWKPEIKKLLNAEIMRRYYYQKGYIRNSLNGDKDLAAALKVLGDKQEYRRILSGPKRK